MLKCLFALLITCSHVYLIWWSQTTIFICFNDHMLQCSHASMIKCFHVYMPWWSYAPMSTCFDDHILTCRYAFILTVLIGFNDRLFPCSHAWKLKCLIAHMLGCQHVWMFTHSHALVITWSIAPMFTCIDIHMFDIHTYVHTLVWWYVYMLEGLSDHAIGNSWAEML